MKTYVLWTESAAWITGAEERWQARDSILKAMGPDHPDRVLLEGNAYMKHLIGTSNAIRVVRTFEDHDLGYC